VLRKLAKRHHQLLNLIHAAKLLVSPPKNKYPAPPHAHCRTGKEEAQRRREEKCSKKKGATTTASRVLFKFASRGEIIFPLPFF
jgi:hypothetical protein